MHEAVGPAATTPVPAGTRLLDVRGRFVIPGLWDMHVHNDVPGGRSLLPLYIAHGVTGVRDMNGALGNLRQWQREITAGALVGPRMVMSGPYLVGARVPLQHILTRTAADGISAVDSLARLRVDFIKVHNALPPDAYFAIARRLVGEGWFSRGMSFLPLLRCRHPTPVSAAKSI